MNIFLNEYFGFCFELNHFWAKFNEKMNFQNVSNRATHVWHVQGKKVKEFKSFMETSRSFFLLQVAAKRDAIPLVEVSRRKSEQEKLKLSWVQYHWLSFQRERVKERRGSGAGSLRPI